MAKDTSPSETETELERAIWTFLAVAAIVLVLGSPVFYVSWRRERTDTIRNFLIGAGVVSLMSAILVAVSDRQVAQCQSAGNSDCIDAGAAGMQLVMISIYVLAAWFAAASISRDS